MATTETCLLSLDERLDALFASDPVAMADPAPVYRELLAAGGPYRHRAAVLITSHADLKRMFRSDGSDFSNRSFIEGSRAEEFFARLTADEQRAHIELSAFEGLYVSRSDGEQHDRLRKIAHRAFTPRRILELRQSMQRYTDELLSELANDDVADFMTLAFRLPLMVIADLLGVPPEDRDLIRAWSKKLGRNRNASDPTVLVAAHGAMLEFRSYVRQMIEQQRQNPGETDLVAALLEAEAGDQLTDEELAAMFVVLLFAGHETTTNLIGIGLLELLRERRQWELFCADPSLTDNAVEELLRFVTPVQWLGRVVRREVTYGTEVLAAGTTVVPLMAAGNRDPEIFDAPDVLDIRRADARQHLALGFGTHFCLGAALARLEGAVALRTLATRFPKVEIAVDIDGLAWTGNAMFRTVEMLPVQLGQEWH